MFKRVQQKSTIHKNQFIHRPLVLWGFNLWFYHFWWSLGVTKCENEVTFHPQVPSVHHTQIIRIPTQIRQQNIPK
jgi:hypothetical protein